MRIPHELAELRQFVVWRLETKPGDTRATKVPYNPRTGDHASSTEPATWGSLSEAQTALAGGFYNGIGFVITPPFVGIDFDYCIDEHGVIDEPIKDAIEWFDSYTEISPSGRGIHILTIGSFDGKGFNRTVGGRKIEVYQTGRYFTFTGNFLGEQPKQIADRTDHVKEFYELLKQKTEKPKEERPPTEPRPSLSLSDSEIVEKASRAKNGAKFDSLYAGSTAGYDGDDSRADEALCYLLAFFTKDEDQIDRIFRSSGLYRPKWERADYRHATIQNAINGVQETYNPQHGNGRIVWGGVEYARNTEQQPQPDKKRIEILNNDERAVNRTDVGNAIRLVKNFGKDIRYCYAWEKWLVWDGTRWKIDDTATIKQMAKETARRILYEAAEATDKEDRLSLIKWAIGSEANGRIKSMIELAQSEPGVPVLVDDLNANPFLLNLKNGTLDLMTGELRAHRREDLITKICPVNYEPSEKCYIFDEFLQTIFQGDSNLINFVRRAVGYSLTGSIKEQALFMCYGIGANGKSTFLDVISELMGDYSQSLPMHSLMVKNIDSGIPNDIAKLTGSRFVSAVETDEGKRLSESLIKQLTGGDVITARFMRAEFFDFKPSFKIWMGVNHRPVINGTDYGIWRRVKLVPFDVVIPETERDTEMPEKLRAEISGILNWAILGCLEWGSQGLLIPESVKSATDNYRQDMDRLADFIAERCNIGAAFKEQGGVLYQAYKQWAEQEGVRPLDSKKFKNNLVEKGFECKHTKTGKVYYGLTLWSDTGI